jgi:hypothetical protein
LDLRHVRSNTFDLRTYIDQPTNQHLSAFSAPSKASLFRLHSLGNSIANVLRSTKARSVETKPAEHSVKSAGTLAPRLKEIIDFPKADSIPGRVSMAGSAGNSTGSFEDSAPLTTHHVDTDRGDDAFRWREPSIGCVNDYSASEYSTGSSPPQKLHAHGTYQPFIRLCDCEPPFSTWLDSGRFSISPFRRVFPVVRRLR